MCSGKKTDTSEAQLSREIDRALKNEQRYQQNLVKVMLLGPGDSGKSTFLRQVKKITGTYVSDDEFKEYEMMIYSNVIRGIQVLMDARRKLEIEWEDNSNEKHTEILFSIQSISERMTREIFTQAAPLIKKLWMDSSIKQLYERRNEFLLADTVKYFFDNIDRLSQRGYKPSFDDILRCRKPTKQILEYRFVLENTPFLMVDVGGQRSQRQKWYQYFDNVTSIIYLIPCSDYDKVILEDRKTNVLVEALNIFDSVVNHPSFVDSSIILFFNKVDLLEKKYNKVNIKDYFPDFPGDYKKLDHVKNYITRRFKELCPPGKAFFHHFTMALDTENMKFVLNAVKETILENNLKTLLLE